MAARRVYSFTSKEASTLRTLACCNRAAPSEGGPRRRRHLFEAERIMQEQGRRSLSSALEHKVRRQAITRVLSPFFLCSLAASKPPCTSHRPAIENNNDNVSAPHRTAQHGGTVLPSAAPLWPLSSGMVGLSQRISRARSSARPAPTAHVLNGTNATCIVIDLAARCNAVQYSKMQYSTVRAKATAQPMPCLGLESQLHRTSISLFASRSLG